MLTNTLGCCLFVLELELSTGPKFPARLANFVLFGAAWPGINILQNLYKGLNILGKTKTHENFVKYGYNL